METDSLTLHKSEERMTKFVKTASCGFMVNYMLADYLLINSSDSFVVTVRFGT